MNTFIKSILILSFLTSFSLAQSNISAGAGAIVSLPVGSFSDGANLGFGGTASFEYKFAPQIAGVGRIGYISYGTDSDNASFSTVPVLVGVKYFFVPGIDFYGIGQLGLNFFSTSVDIPSVNIAGFSIGGGSVGGSSSQFTFAFGGGYELPLSPGLSLDLSSTFQIISDFSNIQVRVGVKTAL